MVQNKFGIWRDGLWWGSGRTLGGGGADRRATSEQINKQRGSRRTLEILPGLGKGFPTPFNNAPDKLFNTHILSSSSSPLSRKG
jgi:hypothetical protein